MSEEEEKEITHKRIKRKAKTKANLEKEEIDDESNTKIKKRKKRSRTTKKDKEDKDDNENDNLEEIEEKPKRKRRRKKNKEEEEENNNEDEENEGKTKKKRRRRKKQYEEENNNNEEDENEEKRKKKRRRKKKEDEENSNNEEEDENQEKPKKIRKKKDEEEYNEENKEESIKKKKKKRKLLEEAIKSGGGVFSSNDVKIEFYKTAKSLVKKKKKKKRKKDDDEEEEKESKIKLSTLSNKLKSKKKKVNNLLINKIKSEENEEENININSSDNNNNEYIDLNQFDNSEENWPLIKKEFLKTIEKYMKENSFYDNIDIALVSTINLSKKEYGDFKLTRHHEIYPIKNFNNINWAKEPFTKLRDKFYELAEPGNLISKNNYLDFSNRVCNEYEIYTGKIPLHKASGKNIIDKIDQSEFSFLSQEQGQTIKKPHLLLFFSVNDEKSILFYKEVLKYLKENGDKFIFLPIFAEIIQAPKNMLFVTEMLYRHKVYKIGEPFEIYFCSDDSMNKRFKYISEDNKKTITCKVAFIDIINEKYVVRAVRTLDSFTFNLIDSKDEMDKDKWQNIKKNLIIFKKKSKIKLKNTSLIEPYNCNLFLRKAKIYTISKEDKKLKVKYTLYDSLTGGINCHNLYKENFQKLDKLLNTLFYYKLRTNPKNLNLSKNEINNLIIEEMSKCIQSNEDLKNVKYQSIFQTQKIIISLGLDSNQKFESIKTKSFKLEIHLDYKLFYELNTMNIIDSLYGLTSFTYFNNCDYIACFPKIGETFPDSLNLTDPKTLKEKIIPLNTKLDKPSLLIIFSLSFQNYFSSNELSSRFKLIVKKLSSIYKDINIILIYRGEPSLFKLRFEQIKEDEIFNLDFPLYIQSSADMKFPLLYRNNDIESTDSQIMTFILNKNNKLVYTGNLEDIELDKTFEKLYTDNNENLDDIIIYREYAKLTYEDFKEMINPTIKQIEEIIEEEFKADNLLFYRPFFSLSYNCYTNFENEETDNERYINHIRLRILVKQKHSNIFTKNKEFKNIIAKLKKYGVSTIVMGIPCEKDFKYSNKCIQCQKKIEISQNEPAYFDELSNKIYCEKCGFEFSEDIKNNIFLTFINTQNYNEEVISEINENYIERDININPVLGKVCKICHNQIGDCYYINLTNFNIDYIESPLTPIDICGVCFDKMKSGDSFLNEPLKRLNYEKFGLNYKQMIYRKIFIPLTGKFN